MPSWRGSKKRPSVMRVEDRNVAVHGTSLRGHINVDYDTLVRVLGEPERSDFYKTQVEWAVRLYDEETGESTVVTVYDWKQGDCYLGEGNGIPPEAVTTWNVGGYSSDAYYRLNDLLMTVQEMAA
jgi:hypothetical protein